MSVQISTFIDDETKRELDAYSEEHGVKQSHLIEQALRHHLMALRELPDDVIMPKRIVLTPESSKRVLHRLQNPEKPTAALRRLMKRK